MSASPDAPRTILAVDDESSVLNVLARLLRAEGYLVLTAAGVAEAEAAAAVSPLRLDLLIVDAGLPDGTGREAAERVLLRHPKAAVLYVSGAPPAGGAEGGAFLLKPFDRASLLDAVGRLLRR
ncbi:MAG: response regulator transcription factor [Elusimicrobia bacterium]|nr:response regulator transcription factor [Elusimicrobiota bacterium]